jgi:hypothetical protein
MFNSYWTNPPQAYSSQWDGYGGQVRFDANGGVISLMISSASAARGGTLTMQNVATFDHVGNFTANGSVNSPTIAAIGSGAMLQFQDRAGGSNPTWGWYANGGIAALWNANSSDRIHLGLGSFTAAVDNQLSNGLAATRWTVVYAVSGTINTSDARDKRWRGALTKQELAAASDLVEEIGVYQWLESLDEKGEAARLHIGVLAQTVGEIMDRHGLDPHRYGFFCYDEWDENSYTDVGGNEIVESAGNRYSVRYDELALFMLAAQGQNQKALEARIAALEARP